MADFSEDLGVVFKSVLGASPTDDTENLPTDGEVHTKASPFDLKFKKTLAKRIVKAVKEPLEDATRKESEMRQRSYEKELRDLDRLLEHSVSSRRDSLNGKQLRNGGVGASHPDSLFDETRHDSVIHDVTLEQADLNGGGDATSDLDIDTAADNISEIVPNKRKGNRQQPTPESMPPTNGVKSQSRMTVSIRKGSGSRQGDNSIQGSEPPTPPMSSGDDPQPFVQGGIPWYMKPFDPSGTTIEEERWTGRDLVRGMSEDLSDMDEDELSGLVDAEGPDSVNGAAQQKASEDAEKKRKANARRRRKRGFR